MAGEEKYGTKAIIALLADIKNKISDIEENAVNKEDFKELTDKVTALEEQLDTKEDIFSPGEGLEMTEDRILNITLDLEIFWVNSTVPDTPPVGKSNKILLVPNPSSTDEGNYYTEYIWVVDTEHPDGHYEELGTYKSDVDLSIYQTKTDNNLQTTNKTVVGSINEIKQNLDNISELPIKKGTGKNSLIIGDIENNISDGENSIASGTKHETNTITKASEKGAHAFGLGVQALSKGSLAEGVRTVAGSLYEDNTDNSSFEGAHAEGYRTKALFGSTHAEGGKITGAPENRAYKYASHTEGASNTSFGIGAHAEGTYTLAADNASHSEGIGITYCAEPIPNITFNINDKQIIIEDDYTKPDISSIVGGVVKIIIIGAKLIINDKIFTVSNVELIEGNTIVTIEEDLVEITNIDYFAVYNKGFAEGQGSHVEGSGNKTLKPASHAEGALNEANAHYCHVEGSRNIVNGQAAHGEGDKTIADGKYSHTEGQYTQANNENEHAQGKYNKSNTGETSDLQTIHSIGIGSSEDDRKNAVEVMGNGDVYLYGVGNYNGTNPTVAKRLQDIINNIPEYIIVPTLTADYTIPANATTKEYIYEISIGATTYNVTVAEGIKWIDNNLPLIEANSKLIVSVVNNIAVWGIVYE